VACGLVIDNLVSLKHHEFRPLLTKRFNLDWFEFLGSFVLHIESSSISNACTSVAPFSCGEHIDVLFPARQSMANLL
jgi:hypothetical protein